MKKSTLNKITLGFLNIDYLYKVLCNDGNFYHFLSCVNLQYFDDIKAAEKAAINMDIKNLKILQIDEFNNVKTLKFINN